MSTLREILEVEDAVAVADSYSLYGMAAGHNPSAAALGEAVVSGRLRLAVPAIVLAVTYGMRTCGDEDCTRAHEPDPSARLDAFCALDGVETVSLAGASAMTVGSLYGACVGANYHGAEILAACHAAAIAKERKCRLLTTARASYCYILADFQDLSGRKVVL
ncbi:hypothetical protein AB0M44_38325 [Streptosporangium subroseum]|uniref:hypothetical protein n=1 Tax=Streptosporangium subroseum TaxID=106412 RepID=UPI0034390D66